MRSLIIVMLPGMIAAVLFGTQVGALEIGPNETVFPEPVKLGTPWVKRSDAEYRGIHESGEPNAPGLANVTRFAPQAEEVGERLMILIPEELDDFQEQFLRPAYLFPDIEPPSPSQLELDGPRLRLGQLLRLALSRNMEVQILRMESEVQEARVWQAMAEFDPVLEASVTWEDLNRPQNTQDFLSSGGSIFDPGVGTGEPRRFEEQNQRYNFRFTGKAITGATYELNTRVDRIRSTLTRTSEANIFDPEFTSRVGITITQPLARDAGRSINLAAIRVARKNEEISALEVQAKVLEVVSRIITAYIDLVFHYNEIRLSRLETEILQLLLVQREDQVERGLVSARQLREVQARLGEALDSLLQAEQRFEQRRREILRLAASSGDPDHNRNFIPVGQLRRDLPSLDEQELLANARGFRIDYLKAQRELEAIEIELGFVRNQKLSRLDLVATGGFNGLEGNAYRSLANGVGEPYPDFTIGLVFSRPWNNSRARGREIEVQRRRMQGVMEIRQLEHETAFQIRSALGSIEQLERRLEAAARIRGYFQEEVIEEELQLERGNRSIYDTLQFFGDLSSARIRELGIVAELNKALIQLYTADGSLLHRLGIDFVE